MSKLRYLSLVREEPSLWRILLALKNAFDRREEGKRCCSIFWPALWQRHYSAYRKAPPAHSSAAPLWKDLPCQNLLYWSPSSAPHSRKGANPFVQRWSAIMRLNLSLECKSASSLPWDSSSSHIPSLWQAAEAASAACQPKSDSTSCDSGNVRH